MYIVISTGAPVFCSGNPLHPEHSNSPLTRVVPTVAVESLVPPHNSFKWPMTPAELTQHKKKETAEDCKARKTAEATTKSSKTKVANVLSEADSGLAGSQVTVSVGSTVINCIDGTVSLGTPILGPVSDSTGKVVAMLQLPDNLPPLPISADIPRGKTGRCSSIKKNLQPALEDREAEDYSGESEQGSNKEGGHPTEEKLPSDDEREEELIPNP